MGDRACFMDEICLQCGRHLGPPTRHRTPGELVRRRSNEVGKSAVRDDPGDGRSPQTVPDEDGVRCPQCGRDRDEFD